MENGIKSLLFGTISQDISNSDISPEDKTRLFSRQIWLKFISWFLRVIVLGGVVLCLNNSYTLRQLALEDKKGELQIEIRRYAFSDSLNSKYLNLYTNYSPEQRYRFLNHMRFTAPDSVLRKQYDELYKEFEKIEYQLVQSSISARYKKELTALDGEVEKKATEIENFRADSSEESQKKARQSEYELQELLEKRDAYEHAIDKVSNTSPNPESPITAANQKEQGAWDNFQKTFSLKESFNTEYFIQYLADRNLVVGLKDVSTKNPESALVFVRVGSFQKPAYYEEKRIKLGESADFVIEPSGGLNIPTSLKNQTVKLSLNKVWRSGIRREWAEFECAFISKH